MLLFSSPRNATRRPVANLPSGRLVFVLALLSVIAPPAAASGQITTDRPDFVESSLTVGPRMIQVESSIAYQRSGPAASRTAAWSTPTLLRWGLGASWEFRLETDGVVADASASGFDEGEGFGDVALGAKWHAGGDGAGAPSTALLLHLDVPTGSRELRGEGHGVSLRGVLEWSFPHGVSAGFMPGVVSEVTDDVRHVSGVLGGVVGKEVTDRTRVFLELAFPRVAASRHGGTEGQVNAGAAWLVGPDLQLDAAISVGVTDAAPDHGITLGVSRRLALPGS